jgi:hypothetical protein
MKPDQTEDDSAGDATVAELTDAIALEAVTAAVSPLPEVREPAQPVLSDGPMGQDGEVDPMLGRRLGAYRLIGRIGDGRAGSVYLAHHLSDCEQHVALKLINGGMDSEAILR